MIAKSVSDIIQNHVTLELEGIDRMYLNGYVPTLQSPGAVAFFIRNQYQTPLASTRTIEPLTRQFIGQIESFVEDEQIDLVAFQKGERKDDVARKYLDSYEYEEGVMFVGKAQEKARVIRTQRRTNPDTGATYPWLYHSTAMVNHYYFYIYDADFGPLFIKFCSYFPYSVKMCINGNEWLKCQLRHKGIAFEALDNGIYSCAEPNRVQKIADTLNANKIDKVFRKWLRWLPHPFTAQHRAAGYRYQLSILQAEFALTQVLDRPMRGREFFEQVIRENLDLGRPDKVQLIFDRRVIKTTPGQFRTRVLTRGVTPTLHVDYKHSKIKQYHKEERALRTETTINNTYDFNIGRMLNNLDALRQIGFKANRRLLHVQTLSHNCLIGAQQFEQLNKPVVVGELRASALRFGDNRVFSLMYALCQFTMNPDGLRHNNLRPAVAQLLGTTTDEYTQGKMTYDLRRLRLHGIVQRIDGSHRYRLTEIGTKVTQLFTRLYVRVIRPALSVEGNSKKKTRSTLAIDNYDIAISKLLEEAQLA
jgi:DNA-binding HxlR family transcriptional regulator